MSESPHASESPDARWSNHEDLPNPLEHHTGSENQTGPATPRQRRIGIRVALGLMLTALVVIILLDRYGILH